jgi:polysaccharide biosynthesis protein PslA
MSRHALRLVGAEPEHTPVSAEPSSADLAREAARLAEIAASFALFGLRLDDLSEAAWRVEPADAGYRVGQAAHVAPANDPGHTFPPAKARAPRLSPEFPSRLLQGLDWMFVLVVAELAALWSTGGGLATLAIGQAAGFLAAALALKVGLWLTESYRQTLARARPERTIGGLALGVIGGILTSNFAAPDARAAAALAAILPVAAMVMAGVHAALSILVAAAHKRGAFSESIVIVGATEAAARFATRATRTGEANVLAIVDDRKGRAPASISGAPVAGGLSDLLAWDGLAYVDRIVVAVPPSAEARVRTVVKRLSALPNRVDLLIDIDAHSVRGRGAQRFAGAVVACVSGRPHHHRRALVKRVQDIALASAALVALLPALMTIAAAIRLGSRGAILFRQRRVGFNNRAFTLLKFRTMEADTKTVTRVGAFLRRYGVDELPQLINVMRGDMSLVGPRPHEPNMKAGARAADAILTEYAHRHRVKPGITGWAQINGCRGAVTSPAALRQRLRFDLDYIARASLWFDLQIITRTPFAMWKGPPKPRTPRRVS